MYGVAAGNNATYVGEHLQVAECRRQEIHFELGFRWTLWQLADFRLKTHAVDDDRRRLFSFFRLMAGDDRISINFLWYSPYLHFFGDDLLVYGILWASQEISCGLHSNLYSFHFLEFSFRKSANLNVFFSQKSAKWNDLVDFSPRAWINLVEPVCRPNGNAPKKTHVLTVALLTSECAKLKRFLHHLNAAPVQLNTYRAR